MAAGVTRSKRINVRSYSEIFVFATIELKITLDNKSSKEIRIQENVTHGQQTSGFDKIKPGTANALSYEGVSVSCTNSVMYVYINGSFTARMTKLR